MTLHLQAGMPSVALWSRRLARYFGLAFILGLVSVLGSFQAHSESDLAFDPSDAEMDRLVDLCLDQPGIGMIEGSDVLCYNEAIFPEQFLALNDYPPVSRIIITSPGGNVATARLMSTILDNRDEPVTIAGPCMSACAMMILPGLDDVWIHHTAHIAVHGIAMMPHSIWWGWLKDDAKPPARAKLMAQLGYDFAYTMHDSGRGHMVGHLEGQDVAMDYIQIVSDSMLDDGRSHDCRVDPKDYWGMLDAEHLKTWLGDRITRMEAFAQSWDDPNNLYYTATSQPIGEKTYIFNRDYADAGCT